MARKSEIPWAWLGLGGAAAYAAYVFFGDNPVVPDVITQATRSPEDILRAVADVDPEHNPALQPGANGGTTWCNKAVALITAKLGVPIIWGEWGTRANDQIIWLQQGNGGWYPGNKDDAQAAALAGHVSLATYFNLNPPPSDAGHIAIVLPYPGTMQIAQAGRANFNMGPLTRGFGSIQPQFFIHD